MEKCSKGRVATWPDAELEEALFGLEADLALAAVVGLERPSVGSTDSNGRRLLGDAFLELDIDLSFERASLDADASYRGPSGGG